MFHKKSLSVIMARSINKCNATCLHCNIPEEDIMNKTLSLEEYEEGLKKMEFYLRDEVLIIWEGGEVLLLPVDYYYKAYEITKKYIKKPSFSMQTNFLKYNPEIFKMYEEVFNFQVSTSYDFFSKLRNLNGNVEKYKNVFFKNIKQYQKDTNFKPYLINVVNFENQDKYNEIFDICREEEYNIRFNRLHMEGNALINDHLALNKEKYRETLTNLTKRWIEEDNNIIITPIYPMLEKYLFNINRNLQECPFTSKCTGQFISLEPDGKVSNCIELSNTKKFDFGNILKEDVEKVFKNKNVTELSKRTRKLHEDCKKCPYHYACQGGCMAMSVISEDNPFGKFEHCEAYLGVYKTFDKYDKDFLKEFYTEKKFNYIFTTKNENYKKFLNKKK